MTARPFVIIPARGGSTRIHRKNLAMVGDRTLLGHAIVDAVEYAGPWRVIVSTDDPKIAAHARSFAGVVVAERDAPVDGDETVLEHAAAVVRHFGADAVAELGARVLIWQPTCVGAAAVLSGADDERLPVLGVYVVAEHHARYAANLGPLYLIPRQNSNAGRPVTYREVGLTNVSADLLLGEDPAALPFHVPEPILSHCPAERTIDVDWPEDLAAARALVAPKYRIAFVVLAGTGYGLGHRRRAETLYGELARHDLDVYEIAAPGAVPALDGRYDVVVVDALDLTAEQAAALGAHAPQVVAFETRHAVPTSVPVTVIDELAETEPFAIQQPGPPADDRNGPRWAVIPAEMRALPTKPGILLPGSVRHVVATFGGQDVAGHTARVCDAWCDLADLASTAQLRVLIGPEQPWPETLGDSARARWTDAGISFVRGAVMLDELRRAHVAITSGGRTVHEAWACGTPVVVLPANGHERTHHTARWAQQSAHSAVERALTLPLDRIQIETLLGPARVRGGTDRVVGTILGAAERGRREQEGTA